MTHYTLHELESALRAEPDMPAALYADAGETAKRTTTQKPEYSWMIPYLENLVQEYENTPIQAPTFQAYANWE